jgi:branched-chain amino acid transport system substrate-binding protein
MASSNRIRTGGTVQTHHSGILGCSILALAVATAVISVAAPAVAADGPIKIGILHPFSGPLAVVGIDATNGFVRYFDEIGNKVAGRDIVLIKEDDAANPGQGMERTRRLVERDKVDMVTGITSSAVAYAVRDYIDEKQMPLIVMGSAGANDITDKLGSPYIFRTSFSNRQLAAPFGPYACNKMGYKKIVIMASDFVTGAEESSALANTYKAAGCEVVKEIKAPLGTVDFAPFLSQVPTSGVDAVWAMFFAADAIAFVKQYEAFGLKAKLPLVGPAGFADQTLLPAMGKAATGIVVTTFYTSYFDLPENKRFVDGFRAKYNVLPGSTALSGYVGAMAIAAAIEAVGGKVEDKPAFLAALRKVKLTTPMGPFRFDEKQSVIFDLYVTKVAERDGVFVPETVERMATDVDQFGKFK